MIRLKKALAALLAALTILSLASCSGNGAGSDGTQKTEEGSEASRTSGTAATQAAVLPSSDPGHFYVDCENVNKTYMGRFTADGSVVFSLISGSQLLEGDVTLKIDGEETGFELGNETKEILPYYVYLAYNGADWKELGSLCAAAKLARKNSDAPDNVELPEEKAYNDALNARTKEYISLQRKMPEIYEYQLQIAFDFRNIPSKICSELEITVKGVSKKYDISGIHIDNDTKDDEVFLIGQQLTFDPFAAFDQGMYPSADGRFTSTDISFTAKQAVELNEISFFNDPGTVLTGVKLSETYADGMTVESIWDGKTPVQLVPGDRVTMSISGTDSALAKKLVGSTAKYLVFDYTIDGKPCRCYFQNSFRIRINGYELYAAQRDGVDMLSYYLDYYAQLAE